MLRILSVVCLTTVALCALVFPEVILTGKTSFLMWADHIVNYAAAFNLASYLFQGDIQLWNFYSQMPSTYCFLSFGMFKFQNMITAFTYYIFSPLALDSGQFFHRVCSFVDVVFLLLLNVLGLFLLLKRLTNNRWILFLGAPVFGLFFSAYAFVDGMFFQDIVPLAMYFILCFFETFRWRYVAMGALLLIVSFQHGIVHTFYSHVIVNFFFLACLAWSLIFNRKRAFAWAGSITRHVPMILKPALGCMALALVILGPYIYMQLFCLKDFELGLATSRFHNLWDVNRYFHVLPMTPADYKDIFRRMMDFMFVSGETAWSCSYFMGYLILFLAVIGVVMSRNSKKWIFCGAALLTWLINFPRESLNAGTPVHWINILTNPVKSMVRTYEMITLGVMPYFLIALAVLGIMVLIDLFQGTRLPQTRRRGLLAAALMALFIKASYPFEPPVVQQYLLFAVITSLTAFGIMLFVPHRQKAARLGAVVLFAVLSLTDIALSAYQTKSYIHDYCTVRPHQIVFTKRPEFMYVDYQNPKIFPFIERADYYPHLSDPILWSMFDMSPNFSRVINRELTFAPYDAHHPRHMSYRWWIDKPFMKDYVTQNPRLFTFVRYAVQNRPGLLEQIMGNGLSRHIITLDASGPGVLTAPPQDVQPIPEPQEQWTPDIKEFKDYYQHFQYKDGLIIWEFPLSRPLPPHVATTALSSDVSIRLAVQLKDKKTVEFKPAQGGLVLPWTFDAQNIREGKVFAALPMDTQFMDEAKAILLIKDKPDWGVQSVWKHKNDETGMIFRAPADGWFLLHYPYDKRWRILVDNKPVRFYRANDSFIALPMTAGNHSVLLQYWPHCWLRWGLWVSAFAAMATLFWLIGFSVRKEFSKV